MSSTKPTILLVEDDEFAAEFADMLLSDHYNVRHAPDGQSALASVAGSLPDLVLMDVSMPGMDGYEVCRQLRSNPEHSELPILFMSGKVGDEERLAGKLAGGNDYLIKPVMPEELLTKIRMALA